MGDFCGIFFVFLRFSNFFNFFWGKFRGRFFLWKKWESGKSTEENGRTKVYVFLWVVKSEKKSTFFNIYNIMKDFLGIFGKLRGFLRGILGEFLDFVFVGFVGFNEVY